MVTGEHGKCGVSVPRHAVLVNERECDYATILHLSLAVKGVLDRPVRRCHVVYQTVQSMEAGVIGEIGPRVRRRVVYPRDHALVNVTILHELMAESRALEPRKKRLIVKTHHA